jgi:hypothetical protein
VTRAASLTADMGFRAVARGAGRDVIGATNVYDQTTETIAQMHRIEAAAETLDVEARRYVSDPVFLASWTRWFQEAWLPFYKKYAGPGADLSWQATAGVLFGDQLARQTESYRQQLAGWYTDYASRRTASGTLVPAPTGHVPAPGREIGKSTSLLPWWAWATLGGVLAVSAYAMYRYYTAEARAAQKLGGLLSATDPA